MQKTYNAMRCHNIILKLYQVLEYKDIKNNKIIDEVVNKTYK